MFVAAQFFDPWFEGGLTISTVPGRDYTVLTKESAISDDVHDGCPAWSPDGRRIAFARSVGGGTRRIYTIDVKTERLHLLTSEFGQNPSWSPNSRRIVYDDGYTIWVMNADGSHKHTLVIGTDPAWSPDGKEIAYTTLGGIWLMHADGDRHPRSHQRRRAARVACITAKVDTRNGQSPLARWTKPRPPMRGRG